MYNHDGSTDQAWQWLFTLVDILGRDGMSSDESEPDEEGEAQEAKVCRVKIRAWRAKWVDHYLTLIDQDRNVTNQYGNHQAGNRPHVRKRPGTKMSVNRFVPPGLPINLYDGNWYNSLSKYQKSDLGPVEELPILDIGKDA